MKTIYPRVETEIVPCQLYGSTIGEWSLHCDGATFMANPSIIGGWGVAVFCNDKLVEARHANLYGNISNNIAEVYALQAAISLATKRGLYSPVICTDSTFALSALKVGTSYRKDNVQSAADTLQTLARSTGATYEHVGRNHHLQMLADYLANLGLYGDKSYASLESRIALLDAYRTWV